MYVCLSPCLSVCLSVCLYSDKCWYPLIQPCWRFWEVHIYVTGVLITTKEGWRHQWGNTKEITESGLVLTTVESIKVAPILAVMYGGWVNLLPDYFGWNRANYFSSALATDIHQRYQTSTTALCNGIVSHGAQFGGLQVFADHTRKSKRKINALMILAHCTAFNAWLSSRSDRSTCR